MSNREFFEMPVLKVVILMLVEIVATGDSLAHLPERSANIFETSSLGRTWVTGSVS